MARKKIPLTKVVKKLKEKPEPNPVGQPPIEITQEMIVKAHEMASHGLTQEQIASCLGMGLSTLYEKKINYPELADAIKRGKDKGINMVANALFENAMNGEKVAQIFYLKARAGWKETNVSEHHIVPPEDWLEKLK
jgi:hypothetical protein